MRIKLARLLRQAASRLDPPRRTVSLALTRDVDAFLSSRVLLDGKPVEFPEGAPWNHVHVAKRDV